MATIESLASGDRYYLSARHLIGRSRRCHLVLDKSNVSGAHAEIFWTGSGWQLRDLGSRNGTFVDGRKLSVNEQVPLSPGSEFEIGVRDQRFRLIDDSPPRLFVSADDGEVVLPDAEILCLPSPESCEVTIFRDADERWRIETDQCTRALEDEETIIAGGRAWRVHLPAQQVQTRDAKLEVDVALADVRLAFFASRDGEYVAVKVKLPHEEIPLEPRAHALLLLTLARCRESDAKQEQLSSSEHGWVHREDLLKMLAIDSPLLNLWVYRARRQLTDAHIRGAAGIIERRSSSSQLRIGVSDFDIESA